MVKRLKLILALAVLSATTVFGQGTILWDESVNGPLSEDFNQPTSLGPMQIGINSIIGLTAIVPPPPFWEYHPNYFTFEVPKGLAVQAINLQVDKPNVWAWIGNPEFSSQLAFTMNPSTGELLSQWALGSIPSGSYGMYLENLDQQSFTSVASYRLDFFVQAVPEPGTFWLLVAGAGLVVLRGWRKAQRVRGAR